MKIAYTKYIDIKTVNAGIVPKGSVLVHQVEESFFDYESNGECIEHSFVASTDIFEAGDLAPIEFFQAGTLLDHGQTENFEDDKWGRFTITNCGGRVTNKPGDWKTIWS